MASRGLMDLESQTRPAASTSRHAMFDFVLKFRRDPVAGRAGGEYTGRDSLLEGRIAILSPFKATQK